MLRVVVHGDKIEREVVVEARHEGNIYVGLISLLLENCVDWSRHCNTVSGWMDVRTAAAQCV